MAAHEDRLNHAERIRLEAFAQIGQRHMVRPIDLDAHMTEAEKLEKWLKEAKDQ